MSVSKALRHILFEKDLKEKLIVLDNLEWESEYDPSSFKFSLPSEPGRNSKIEITDKRIKFPKKQSLSVPEKKAQALNSFANHELLAVEMMAASILLFPHQNEDELRFKKGILSTLIDEQKHFSLYLKRMNELGFDFGDFPLNDFFWKQMGKIKTRENYLSIMSITFEGANLDFAKYYEKVFLELGDEKTASILKEVYIDEITHVRFGVNYLKKWKNDKSLWDYYLETLPYPITPSRAKGIEFNEEARAHARMDSHFIEKLQTYKDDFKITQRKTWK